MTVAPITGGAVALLLCGPRLPGVAGAHAQLRTLVGSPITEIVDAWIAGGGPDGEQIYCLEDLLGPRLAGEAALHRGVEEVLSSGSSGSPIAVEALKELSRHCREQGFLGGYDWCQQALATPRGLGQAPPAPLNRTVTAPR